MNDNPKAAWTAGPITEVKDGSGGLFECHVYDRLSRAAFRTGAIVRGDRYDEVQERARVIVAALKATS